MITMPDHAKWPALRGALESVPGLVVAVSGGVDSLLLATVSHLVKPGKTLMCHAVSPAVPQACTGRVRAEASAQGWDLKELGTGEFDDERYVQNPFDRCYFCKAHLYGAMSRIAGERAASCGGTPVIVSGANTDDLREHRPGLDAARDFGVRHPFVEADVCKADIRAMARSMGLSFADIPASPCLASRVYTGTRVTPERLQAVEFAENALRKAIGRDVVRCRVQEDRMLLELPDEDRPLVTPGVLADLERAVMEKFDSVRSVALDPEGYRPGRAFTRQEG